MINGKYENRGKKLSQLTGAKIDRERVRKGLKNKSMEVFFGYEWEVKSKKISFSRSIVTMSQRLNALADSIFDEELKKANDPVLQKKAADARESECLGCPLTLRYVYEPQFACPKLVRSAITGRLEKILVTMHERSGTVHVCDTTTVDALRDSMSYRFRLRYATVQIAYNGQVMENGDMLRHYGVRTGHCITVRYKDILEDKRLKQYVPNIMYYEDRRCPYTQYERRRDMARKCLTKLRRALEFYSEFYGFET